MRSLCSACFVTLWMAAQTASASDVYFAARIWTGESSVIEDGALVVHEGKVEQVGRRADIRIPDDGTIHDLGTAVLIPGLVIAHTRLASGSDDGQLAVAPHHHAIDGFDFFEDFAPLLKGGVTSIQVAPGGDRLMPGQGAVVKLAGKSIKRRTLSAHQCLHLVLTRDAMDPPSFFQPPVGAVSVDKPLLPARPQLAGSLASAVSGVRALLRASTRQSGLVVSDETDPVLLAIADYRSEGRTIQCTAETAAEIRAAIGLAREFDLRCILVDTEQLEPWSKKFESFRPHIRGIVLRSEIVPGRIRNLPVPGHDELPPTPLWTHARELVESGIKVAVRPATDDNLPDMLFTTGLFRRSGLSTGDLLKMVTLWPAEMLGVAGRVGSLSSGKDADFVVLTRDPFRTGSQIRSTYVDGQAVYERPTKETTTVVRAGRIYDGNSRVIRNGAVVVEQGVIRQVAQDVSAPPQATVRHYPDGVIVPGFIDLGTGLGLGGPLTGTISVQTRLGEQLYSGDPAVDIARQGGVTTVLLTPTGSSPGPVVAFKLADKLRVVKDPVALRFTLQGNLTSSVATLQRTLSQAKAYHESWQKYEAELADYKKKLAQYEQDKTRYDEAVRKQKEAAAAEKKETADKQESKDADGDDKKVGASDKSEDESTEPEDQEENDDEQDSKKPDSDSDRDDSDKKDSEQAEKSDDSESKKGDKLKAPAKPEEPKKPRQSSSLEPYRNLFARKIPALVVADKVNEIQAAIKLLQETFKLRTIVVGAEDVVRKPELLNEKTGYIVGPELVRTVEQERVSVAQFLASRAVPFGFQSQARTGVQQLPLAVQYAVHHGLSPADALRGLTSSAAQLISLDKQLGTLAAGKDADLVVLSGPPFASSSRIRAVMIDGQWVYEEDLDQ